MSRVLLLFFMFFAVLQVRSQSTETLNLKWDRGLVIKSSDEQFWFKFGGLYHHHITFLQPDTGIENTFGKQTNGTEIRRIFLNARGTFYDKVFYKLQFDLARGPIEYRDAYVGVSNIPVIGNILVGQVKLPLRLENMESIYDLTFVERTPLFSVLDIRESGLMMFNDYANERLTGSFGVFRDTDDLGISQSDEKYSLVGRLTALPVDREDGRFLIHAGFGYAHQLPDNEVYRFRSRPEANMAPLLLNTGDIRHTTLNQVSVAEFAVLIGSFSIESEYGLSTLSNDSLGTLNFSTGYAMVRYFLTGEQKGYNRKWGFVGGMKPKNNVGKGSGIGAIELAMRYSYSDYNDASVNGGELGNLAFAINWHLNPAMMIILNYNYATLKNVGSMGIFQLKTQFAF